MQYKFSHKAESEIYSFMHTTTPTLMHTYKIDSDDIIEIIVTDIAVIFIHTLTHKLNIPDIWQNKDIHSIYCSKTHSFVQSLPSATPALAQAYTIKYILRFGL